MLPWNEYPARENGHFLDELSDGVRLLNPDGIRIGVADEVSLVIWRLCDGDMTIDEMVDLLASSFGVARPQMAADVQATLTHLHEVRAVTLLDRPLSDNSESKMKNSNRTTPLLIEVQPTEVNGDSCTWSARVNGLEHDRLWFTASTIELDPVDPIADPFVLAVLKQAMRQGRPVEVTGAPLSSGLLTNLRELQQLWVHWRRALSVVEIAGEEVSAEPVNDAAIATFSGGVDSCYTVYSALAAEDRRFQPRIDAAIMLHGFDIPVDQPQAFERALERSRDMLSELDIPLISMTTNAKWFIHDWIEDHGLVLGAAMSILSQKFGTGIIAATNPYSMTLPVGSHFATDRLMSSDRFKFIHHGAGANRIDKIRSIREWSPVDENLRICWSAERRDENCRKCIKCALAAMMFDLYGEVPACLRGAEQLDVVIDALTREKPGLLDLYDLRCLAEESGIEDIEKPWLPTVWETILSEA